MTTNIAGLDENSRNVMKALSSVDGVSIVNLYADPVTHRLLVDTAGGAGTVTSVSIVSANGFAGTVATATTTPAITISTTITGVLKGNGTAISAATDGTDYLSSTTGVTLAQGTAQTIGTTTNRVLKLWATDITVTNAIAGSITGNASTVTTNANLTGDVTSVGNATTLATVNSNVGSFGSATQVATFTVNGKGLTTAASNVTITPAIGSITGLGTGVATALAVNIGSAGAPVLYNGAGGTPSSLTLTNATGLPAASVVAGALGTGAYTMDTKLTVPQVINTNNAITASGNAATVPVTYKINTVTNNSAATLTITMTTTSATDGQISIVRILDFSAVAQTLTFVNTENSTVSVPTTSNGSTTLPLTVGFQYNNATSKWRCISYA